jgi:ribose 5-phosphate isomerase A
MDEAAVTAAKRRAGERAAQTVDAGDVVGLGTGSTAAAAIRELGRRVEAGLDIRGVPTSMQSATVAREAGVPLVTLADATPDVAIDGADQVAGCALLKGGGAAHAREKVVASAATRLVVVVDETKLADALSGPVPLEVLEPAVRPVRDAIASLGGAASLRPAEGKDGPVVTDNGNPVLDADFGVIDDPAALARDLDRVAGLVAHGLFPDHADAVLIGGPDGVTERRC